MALEDEVLSRQMPHDLDAEQAVQGAMLFDAECIKDVMDKLLPEDFYLKQNRDIFTVAYNMFSFSKPIDPLTLAEEMRKSGVYDEQTTRSYLAQLVDFTFSSANVMDYVKILRDKSLLRGLSRAARSTRSDLLSPWIFWSTAEKPLGRPGRPDFPSLSSPRRSRKGTISWLMGTSSWALRPRRMA